MRKYFTLSVILLLWLHSVSFGAGSKVGTTAAQFLKIEIGARAMAMGGAFVATANDATASFWNPAGLATLQSREVAVVHTNWLADMDLEYASIAIPAGGNVFGLSLTALNYGEWDVTTIDEPEGTGEKFGAQDLALGLSYARPLTDRFRFGINFKYISQSIYHMSASAIAFDIGTLFTTQFRGLRIGMSLSNFGSKMSMHGKDAKVFHDIAPAVEGNNENINAYLETNEWDLPLLFRVAVAFDLINNDYSKLTLAVDSVAPNDNTEYINTGMEYSWKQLVFLRSGYRSLFQEDREDGLTLGAGMRYALTNQVKFKFDYAYAYFGRLENIQQLTVGLEF